MYREHDSIKELDNGDLVIKYTEDDIEAAKKDQMLVLSEVLSDVDTYFVGEQYSLGNFSMGITLYNYYSDLAYTLDLADVDKLEEGEEITLTAREPDEDDRAVIDQF